MDVQGRQSAQLHDIGSDPYPADLADAPEVQGDELVQPFVAAASSTANWPANPNTAAMQNSVGQAVSGVISGGLSASDAASQVMSDVPSEIADGGRVLNTATVPAHPSSRSRVGPALSRLAHQPWGYLVPAAWMILAALSAAAVQLARMAFSEVGPTTIVGSWKFVGWSNFREAIDDRRGSWHSVRATGTFTVVLLAIDLVVGYLFACVLSSGTWSTNLALRIMVFVWVLPPIVSGSVWKFLLAGNGAINSVLGLLGVEPVDWLSSPDHALMSVSLVAVWASLPFSILVIHGGMLSLPVEVVEARTHRRRRVLAPEPPHRAPHPAPTLTILTVLIILYVFRSFDFVYVMTKGGPGTATTTLPYFAYDTAFKTYQFGVASALALISILVVVVLAVPYMLGLRKEHAG